MDLYSRRIVGWAMQSALERSLTLSALEMAIAERQPIPGLTHHSDRGSQYACGDYQAALQRHEMLRSMSGEGDVWDSAPARSFLGTLRCERTHHWARPPREQARREVSGFIEVLYDRQRLDSSLSYRAPVPFEVQSVVKAA